MSFQDDDGFLYKFTVMLKLVCYFEFRIIESKSYNE